MTSSAGPTPNPTSHHWTLRLKHARTTILLYSLPVTPFTTLKQDLLTALSASGTISLSDHDIASTEPDDIELAVPNDKWDLRKGWLPLEIPEEDAEDVDEDEGGSKKKASKGRPKKSLETVNKSPQGAGLRDGAVLAFRWKGDEGWDVAIPTYDDELSAEGMEED